ncbi:PREDICTED: uncharacterized protein LOC109384522 [Hipposideros armiger]|uniref:Uncharacterized protein LOC109384522 n=1 Tax=Hipposideros armiger TaxID=186990 RepID=A0A8B7RK89_HIPAR|nr:PREDICTED: uncharacterized protein LOC109384522 [Hipposideros armiger]
MLSTGPPPRARASGSRDAFYSGPLQELDLSLGSPGVSPSPGPGPPPTRRPGFLALTAGRLWASRPETSRAPGGSGRGGTAERAERTAGARRRTGAFAPALLHRLPPPHTHTHTRAAGGARRAGSAADASAGAQGIPGMRGRLLSPGLRRAPPGSARPARTRPRTRPSHRAGGAEPSRHSTRDTDVHGRATLRTHWTSCPLTATASQVTAAPSIEPETCTTTLPSASDPHRPGLPHRPSGQAAAGRAYKPSGIQGSAFTPAHLPDSGARGASRLPGLRAPRGAYLGHQRTLSLPTHTPATVARQASSHTYLRVQVALAWGGVCSGATEIRTAAAVQDTQTRLGFFPLQHF